jgi:hypothetical protein
MCLRKQLSLDSGVVSRSEGNTQDSGSVLGQTDFHCCNSETVCGVKAASRTVCGSSEFLLCHDRPAVQSTRLLTNVPPLWPKYFSGRVPAKMASRAMSLSRRSSANRTLIASCLVHDSPVCCLGGRDHQRRGRITVQNAAFADGRSFGLGWFVNMHMATSAWTGIHGLVDDRGRLARHP